MNLSNQNFATMSHKTPFRLEYTPEFLEQLRVVEAKYRTLIRQTIEDQLRFDADVQTKNRKPLKRPVPFAADWEIRFGPNNQFRVFYALFRDQHEVVISALGIKDHNQLTIGGKVIES